MLINYFQSEIASLIENDCSFSVSLDEFYPSSFAFVFPERSPYLPSINELLVHYIVL